MRQNDAYIIDAIFVKKKSVHLTFNRVVCATVLLMCVRKYKILIFVFVKHLPAIPAICSLVFST